MYVLGIDTSTKVGSVAIYDSERGILASLVINVKLNHSDTIMNAIETVFEYAGITKNQIQAVAVGIGPGSFTGIRVALGTAKGIAFSLNIPIVGVNTLDALAYSYNYSKHQIISMIDARKERVYYSVYQGNKNVLDGFSSVKMDDTIENIARNNENIKTVFVGDGAIQYQEKLASICGENFILGSKAMCSISAGNIAEIGFLEISNGIIHNIFELEPFYISKSQAERLRDSQEKISV